jgi:hypothetical protein
MSTTSLFLVPDDPGLAPELRCIEAVLQDLHVIAAPLAPRRFAAGEGFPRHVIFAGCSPHLVMQPADDGDLAFCHVALHGPFAAPRLVTGPNTVKPRCPHCRRRFDDWRNRLPTWNGPAATAVCDGCGTVQAPVRLDWRQHAVGGRVLIELRNVFPAEAMPSDTLLQRLHAATGTGWQYGWAGLLTDDADAIARQRGTD